MKYPDLNNEEAYKEMAADEEREKEALEWAELNVQDLEYLSEQY